MGQVIIKTNAVSNKNTVDIVSSVFTNNKLEYYYTSINFCT